MPSSVISLTNSGGVTSKTSVIALQISSIHSLIAKWISSAVTSKNIGIPSEISLPFEMATILSSRISAPPKIIFNSSAVSLPTATPRFVFKCVLIFLSISLPPILALLATATLPIVITATLVVPAPTFTIIVP